MAFFKNLLAGIPLIGGIIQGEQQDRQQRRALRSQEQAQRDSAAMAAAQQRRAEQEFAKANRKRVSPGTLLTIEQESAARRGSSSTLLTGSFGVASTLTKLAGKSLLGGSGA